MHVRGLEQWVYTAMILEAHVKRPIESGSDPLRTTPFAGSSLQAPPVGPQPNEQFHCHVPTAIESTARTSQKMSVAGSGWRNIRSAGLLQRERPTTTGDTVTRHFLFAPKRGFEHVLCAHVTAHTQEQDPLDFRGPAGKVACKQGIEGRAGRTVRKEASDVCIGPAVRLCRSCERAGVRDYRSARACTCPDGCAYRPRRAHSPRLRVSVPHACTPWQREAKATEHVHMRQRGSAPPDGAAPAAFNERTQSGCLCGSTSPKRCGLKYALPSPLYT